MSDRDWWEIDPNDHPIIVRLKTRMADPAERERYRRLHSEQDAYLDEHYPGWRDRRGQA